ncbi:unnamed protein product [Moneuplotes crassus]|uniref:Myotubularin phosphatase domain-containing protein n=1 Tax=Euplotes crassus TaxID=5936 RepID=A0AAD1Y521_EUPCR|nr:unnamed protein product [Moneuplotes crassus]
MIPHMSHLVWTSRIEEPMKAEIVSEEPESSERSQNSEGSSPSPSPHDVSQIAQFMVDEETDTPFNLENNIENYFYYTEEDKCEDNSICDHNLDMKFQNLMDNDNISEDFIINDIQFEDIYQNRQVTEGFIRVDLYSLKILKKDYLIDKHDQEKHFIQCEEDSFLEYILNMKNEISEEKMEIMRQEYYHIPYNLAHKLIFQKTANKTGEGVSIEISTKDFRTITILLEDQSTGIQLFENLKSLCFSGSFKSYTYCIIKGLELNVTRQDSVPIGLDHSKKSELTNSGKSLPKNGWEVFNFKKEFERQGVNRSQILFCTLRCWGKKDSLSSTYPEKVYVPLALRDQKMVIIKCAQFRVKERFPALTYHHKNGASLWRSAQISQGIMNNSCEEDELFIRRIGETNPFNDEVYILDARTKMNANANSKCHSCYGGIEGISYINSSYKTIMKFCHNQGKIQDSKFFERLDHSGWYNTIRKQMEFASKAAEILECEQHNVLIHCADGWDRTTILCSLAQIYLDPYFRTIKGLEVLIEKDWVSFGHKFQDRSGNLKSHNHLSKERAPVFISFCDCLFQLLTQFPHCFEYNNTLLLFLSHHVYTCKYGTFLMNCDKDRYFFELRSKTLSIWGYINKNLKYFKNPFYKKREGRITPIVAPASMRFWREHFFIHTKLSGYNPESTESVYPFDHRERMYMESLEEIKRLKALLQSGK